LPRPAASIHTKVVTGTTFAPSKLLTRRVASIQHLREPIHATGPWGITYVNPNDDPRNKKM
jgi:hypothetical protein